MVNNPGDVELRQIAASALINAGCPIRAVNELETMSYEGHTEEETLGLLASACKDIRENSTDPDQQDTFERKALELYKRGFEYMGVMDLPKRYGSFPIYLLHREGVVD
jgi:hypothetical protein